MKQRFEKRRFDKSIKAMAQNLTSEVMFNEYTEMIEEKRERTPERLAWLEEIGPQQALNKFNYARALPETTVAKFTKFAKVTAKQYMVQVIVKMEQHLKDAIEKAESQG